ncbi:MAG: aldo/keto reductase [Clostridia bacterium]|jgi:aryl-alcohol dehydrogenase-like predicted oxidoreductase
MRYKQLGKSDLKVSVVGLGTWAMGGDFWGKIDDQQSISTIQKAIDSGINLIDTAPAYGGGHAERIVGKAIKGRRDEVIIATKCGIVRDGPRFIRHLGPESIRREIDASLSRLGVDVIDLYQIHWPDEKTPLEDSIAELIKIKEAGKFRYLGVSNFDVKLMKQAMGMTDIVSLQPQYSLLHRDIEKEILPFCIAENIGILSYGSLGAGVLTGKYTELPDLEKGDRRSSFYPFFQEPTWSKIMELLEVLRKIAQDHDKPVAHVSINWVNQQEGVTSALVGAKTPEQAAMNAASGEWALSPEELALIDETYQRIFC